jgi:hypothetical protein
MKKILLTLAAIALAAFAFGQQRSLFWELSAPDSITNYISTEQWETDPDWKLDVVSSHEPEAVISSSWGIPYFCSVFIADIGGGYPMGWAYVDLHQAWNYLELPSVPESAELTFTLTYLPTGKSVSNTYTVVGWSAAIWIMDYVEEGTTWDLPAELFIE